MTREKALKKLQQAECEFLKACGWRPSDGHWKKPGSRNVLYSQAAAMDVERPGGGEE